MTAGFAHAFDAPGPVLLPGGVLPVLLPGEARMELSSKTAYLCSVRAFMQSFCPRLGFDGAQSSQIVLAVDEALANVMKHGYQGREDGRILLRVVPFVVLPGVQDGASRGPGVWVRIEDDAPQIDLSQIRSRDLDDVRPGGLGVHIIHRVMDEARYEHREGGTGMRLTLVKFVSSPAVRGDTPGLDGSGLDVPGIDTRACQGTTPTHASASSITTSAVASHTPSRPNHGATP